MRYYETNNIIINNILGSYKRAYFRHTDKTFILFRGTNRQVENMVNYLNSII